MALNQGNTSHHHPLDLLCNEVSSQLIFSYSSISLFVHKIGGADAIVFNLNDKSSSFFDLIRFNKLYVTINKKRTNTINNNIFLKDDHSKGLALAFSSTKLKFIIHCTNQNFLPINDDESRQFKESLKSKSNKLAFLLSALIFDQGNLFFQNYFKSLPKTIGYKLASIDPGQEYINNKHQITETYNFYKTKILGQLLNTLKHELSNPLFGINALSQILHFSDNEINSFLKEVTQKSKDAISVINHCDDFYNNNNNEWKLIETINQTINLLKSVVRKVKLKKSYKIDEDFLMTVNKTWFTQVFTNLLINAIEACDQKIDPCILIEMHISSNILLLQVYDNGSGIEHRNRQQIFDHNFTTKKTGNGIGLFISKILAQKLGGEIFYQKSSIDNFKTQFTFKMSLI